MLKENKIEFLIHEEILRLTVSEFVQNVRRFRHLGLWDSTARSSDLTPLDLYFWGSLIESVHAKSTNGKQVHLKIGHGGVRKVHNESCGAPNFQMSAIQR